ncbi:glycine betaine ABC transporter substrate-binding protein [Proteocatella sphenisci]|uniref:glycine betaine ABC transporter substrate-binding protein n=1 Tax=Proteocatella sphenisci TaxID=181070 RepID=UPI0004AEA2D2|nr:glycine betaine ABC transporter substrate-binding protein [Proteocatella sphenisci]
MNMKKNLRKISTGLLAFVLLFTMAACTDSSQDTIVVGGKDFTEQDILVHLVSEVIEDKTDINVERKPYLGGSSVVASSMQTGDVDIMVEYTGTGLMSVLNMDAINNPAEVLETVRKGYEDNFDIKWLEPLGFNNTFALTMRKDMAEEMGIKNLSDLSQYAPEFTFASTQEFLERSDGYDSIKPFYNIEFKEVKGMDPGLCYTALKENQVDVSISFATDGRIPAFDFVILEDDKQFFPPYDASIIVRNDALTSHPELEDALKLLEGKISDYEMASMNSRVDIDREDAKIVAREWLIENGIINAD